MAVQPGASKLWVKVQVQIKYSSPARGVSSLVLRNGSMWVGGQASRPSSCACPRTVCDHQPTRRSLQKTDTWVSAGSVGQMSDGKMETYIATSGKQFLSRSKDIVRAEWEKEEDAPQPRPCPSQWLWEPACSTGIREEAWKAQILLMGSPAPSLSLCPWGGLT